MSKVDDETIWVGILRIKVNCLFFYSLSDKKKKINFICERFKRDYNTSIAEVGPFEHKTSTVLSSVVTGSYRKTITSYLDKKASLAHYITDGIITFQKTKLFPYSSEFP